MGGSKEDTKIEREGVRWSEFLMRGGKVIVIARQRVKCQHKMCEKALPPLTDNLLRRKLASWSYLLKEIQRQLRP